MSNQPDNGQGDGNTNHDVVVFPDHVCIRRERAGTDRSDRLYTIQLIARDASGNESDPVVQVRVPHDQRTVDRCRVIEVVETAAPGSALCAPP